MFAEHLSKVYIHLWNADRKIAFLAIKTNESIFFRPHHQQQYRTAGDKKEYK